MNVGDLLVLVQPDALCFCLLLLQALLMCCLMCPGILECGSRKVAGRTNAVPSGTFFFLLLLEQLRLKTAIGCIREETNREQSKNRNLSCL